jgi:hypothetical protein
MRINILSHNKFNDMQIEKKIYIKIAWIMIFSSCFHGFGQVSISGPSCVVPGTTYQYNIIGPWDSQSTMQVCITGGSIPSSGSTCSGTGAPLSFVLVNWTAGSNNSIQVTSSKGNSNLNVTVTTPLLGGTINSSTKSQSINYSAVAPGINCSASSGGSCTPNYSYQWQHSLDAVSWTNISGAASQNLSVIGSLKQATFFRRKVIETASGTISYSDVAFVDVAAAPPSTSSLTNMTKTIPNDSADMAFNSCNNYNFFRCCM